VQAGRQICSDGHFGPPLTVSMSEPLAGRSNSREVITCFSPPILLVFALSTDYPIHAKMSRKKWLAFSQMSMGHTGLNNLSA
jgi:hypothetical protein